MGRYGEIWGDMRGYGEIYTEVAKPSSRRYREIWGDMGRCREMNRGGEAE